MNSFSHLDAQGAPRMVDVGDKEVTARMARASGLLFMQAETLKRVLGKGSVKGDVLAVARLAGIQAAKKTSDLIPLCHQLPLDSVSVSFEASGDQELSISAMVTTHGRTGVEMEAMVAVGIAALTVYDMCKSMDRSLEIRYVRLEEKLGGRSGHFRRS